MHCAHLHLHKCICICINGHLHTAYSMHSWMQAQVQKLICTWIGFQCQCKNVQISTHCTKKNQATSQFCFHMLQLGWPVPIFHQSTKRSVSKVIFRCADIMPVHLHICLIASVLVYAFAYARAWSFAYKCTCLKAYSFSRRHLSTFGQLLAILGTWSIAIWQLGS